jgi:adenylate cyclase
MDPASIAQTLQRQWSAIVVVDVVESVRLVQLGQARFPERWTRFVGQVRDALPVEFRGRMVKHLGDGMLLVFKRAVDAVDAALALHRRIEGVNEGVAEAERIVLRAGIACGEVQASELDVFGPEVNQAVLLARLAPPGRTAVSAAVRDRLVHGLDATLEDLGDCYLRDTDEPVRTFLVGPARRPAAEPLRGRVQGLRPTLAVVPFDTFDLSGVQSFLGDALADEVIAALSRNRALSVISRLSTAAFRGRTKALDGIRNCLHADHVLGGRVHLDGDRLRVVLQLTEVASATVIWSDGVAGSARGVFGGTDPLVECVARDVSLALATRSLERARSAPLPTLESYCLLMAAVSLLHGVSREDFDRARQMLEHLIERERRQPAPHAWMAKWHVLRVQQGWGERVRDSRLALDSARRALDLDPGSSLTLSIDGFVHCNLLKDLDGARARYEQALALNPSEPLAWLFQGTLHAFRGEGEPAVASTQRALELSPLDPMRYFFESLSATAALAAGRWELAIERALHSLRLNSSHTSTLRVLTIAHVQLGRLDEARHWAARLLERERGFTIADYRQRSPSMGFATGELWASSLAAAGVPVE